MRIAMFTEVGDFGEDKDAAAALRDSKIRPNIGKQERVTLDFRGVTLVTQSFIHALISDVLRVNGERALDFFEFRNCDDVVKGIISTVVQYSLDTMTDDTPASKTPKLNRGKRSLGRRKTAHTKGK